MAITPEQRIVLLYGVPALFNAISSSFVDSRLASLYLETFSVPPATFAVSSALLGALGLFTDILMAAAIDKTRSKFGKYRPWILFCAPVAALIEILLMTGPPFTSPSSLPSTSSSSFLSSWYLTLSATRSLLPLQIAYSAYASLLPLTPTDRTKALALKSTLSSLGCFLAHSLPVFCARFIFSEQPFSSPIRWYPSFIRFFSSLTAISFLLLVFHVSESSSSSSSSSDKSSEANNSVAKSNFVANLRNSIKNVPFLWILALGCFDSLRSLLFSGLGPFYNKYILHLSGSELDQWSTVWHLIGVGGAILAGPLWSFISSRIGRKKAWILSYGLQLPIGLFIYLFVEGKSTLIFYSLCSFMISITANGSGFLSNMIRSSVHDYEELVSGKRKDATHEALWSTIPRYLSFPGSAISLSIIAMTGFDSTQNQRDGQQPRFFLMYLKFAAALLPSLTGIFSLYMMTRFPITDAIHERVLALLPQQRNRNGQEPVEDPVTGKLLNAWNSDRSTAEAMAADESDAESPVPSAKNALKLSTVSSHLSSSVLDSFIDFELSMWLAYNSGDGTRKKDQTTLLADDFYFFLSPSLWKSLPSPVQSGLHSYGQLSPLMRERILFSVCSVLCIICFSSFASSSSVGLLWLASIFFSLACFARSRFSAAEALGSVPISAVRDRLHSERLKRE